MQKKIDVIVIGLNSVRTLPACLESIRSSRYPQELLTVYYSDGGSRDNSLDVAAKLGARTILVDTEYPTPGRQRNAGWRAGESELVQFLDSDTVMDPEWLNVSVTTLTDGVGAVRGYIHELHPGDSVFNWLGDREWNSKAGETNAFGGNVLIAREILSIIGGYNPELVAAEDTELSYRVRQAGYKIIMLDSLMAMHDLAMSTLKQYWKRARRTGYGFAEIHSLHKDLWTKEVVRIMMRAGLFSIGVITLPFAMFAPWLAFFAVAGTLALLSPRLRLVGAYSKAMSLSREDARIYTWHLSLVAIPQFFGILRFIIGQLVGSPLRNKR